MCDTFLQYLLLWVCKEVRFDRHNSSLLFCLCILEAHTAPAASRTDFHPPLSGTHRTAERWAERPHSTGWGLFLQNFTTQVESRQLCAQLRHCTAQAARYWQKHFFVVTNSNILPASSEQYSRQLLHHGCKNFFGIFICNFMWIQMSLFVQSFGNWNWELFHKHLRRSHWRWFWWSNESCKRSWLYLFRRSEYNNINDQE